MKNKLELMMKEDKEISFVYLEKYNMCVYKLFDEGKKFVLLMFFFCVFKMFCLCGWEFRNLKILSKKKLENLKSSRWKKLQNF